MGKYKRVLLKLSGEALMGKEKSSKVLDKDVLFKVANQVKTLVEDKIDVCIVIGGGNIFRGKYCEELSIERFREIKARLAEIAEIENKPLPTITSLLILPIKILFSVCKVISSGFSKTIP